MLYPDDVPVSEVQVTVALLVRAVGITFILWYNCKLFDTGFYEQSTAGAVAAVPEPSRIALIGLAAAIGVVAGRKRPGC